jgi:hypothetical protein
MPNFSFPVIEFLPVGDTFSCMPQSCSRSNCHRPQYSPEAWNGSMVNIGHTWIAKKFQDQYSKIKTLQVQTG